VGGLKKNTMKKPPPSILIYNMPEGGGLVTF